MEAIELETKELLEEFHDAEEAVVRNYGSEWKAGKHLDALIEVFAERGLILRHGKWEFQENKRLHDNFTTFAREFKEVIGNPVDFVVTSEDKERHNNVQKLKLELKYLRELSRGLFRSRMMVYYNARNVLDPNSISNYQKYSKEEHAKLLEMVEEHGQNWKLIGQLLGRTALSVRNVYFKRMAEGTCVSKPPTEEQLKLLVEEIQRLHPDKDLAVDLIHGLPWSQLAKRINYFPDDLGIQLRNFWETRIKYRDLEGAIRFKKKEDRIPQELYRKFAKHASKAQPTHFNALDWPYYYKMFEGRVASITTLRQLIKNLLRYYKINVKEVGLSTGLKHLYKLLKQQKSLEFEPLTDKDFCTEDQEVRLEQYHWALSPDLAHYIHDRPVMYWGYQQNHQQPTSSDPHHIKQEPEEDPDIVW